MPTDAPPRSLDDLTSDLRARTVRQSSEIMGGNYRGVSAFAPLVDPLTAEAADAIDRLRAERSRPCDELTAEPCAMFKNFRNAKGTEIDRLRAEIGQCMEEVHAFAVLTGALPGDNVIRHLSRARKHSDLAAAISAVADLYLANFNTTRAQEALAGLRKIVADAGYEMLAPSEVAALRNPPASLPDAALTAKAVKSALALLRPILKNHALCIFFVNGDVECTCGERSRNVPSWVEHVLGLLAFGSEPSAAKATHLSHVALVDDPPDPNCRIGDPEAPTVNPAACSKCGATGLNGDFCRCDPEEELPRDDASAERLAAFRDVAGGLSRHPGPSRLRNGYHILAIERAFGDSYKITAKVPDVLWNDGVTKEPFDFVVDAKGIYASNHDYDILDFVPPPAPRRPTKAILLAEIDHGLKAGDTANDVLAAIADAIRAEGES